MGCIGLKTLCPEPSNKHIMNAKRAVFACSIIRPISCSGGGSDSTALNPNASTALKYIEIAGLFDTANDSSYDAAKGNAAE